MDVLPATRPAGIRGYSPTRVDLLNTAAFPETLLEGLEYAQEYSEDSWNGSRNPVDIFLEYCPEALDDSSKDGWDELRDYCEEPVAQAHEAVRAGTSIRWSWYAGTYFPKTSAFKR
jgi:hypothetical protein